MKNCKTCKTCKHVETSILTSPCFQCYNEPGYYTQYKPKAQKPKSGKFVSEDSDFEITDIGE